MMLAIFALALAVAVPDAGQCPGSSTPEIDACLAGRFDKADAELNRYYKAAIKRLREEREIASEQTLVQAERSWVAYRTSECGAVYEKLDRWQHSREHGTELPDPAYAHADIHHLAALVDLYGQHAAATAAA